MMEHILSKEDYKSEQERKEALIIHHYLNIKASSSLAKKARWKEIVSMFDRRV